MAKVSCLDKSVIQAGNPRTSIVTPAAGGRSGTGGEITADGGRANRTAGISQPRHIPHGKIVIRIALGINNKSQRPPLLNGKDKPDGPVLAAAEAGTCAAGQLLSISKVGDCLREVIGGLAYSDSTGAVGGRIRERLWYAWGPRGRRRTDTQLLHPNVGAISLCPPHHKPAQRPSQPPADYFSHINKVTKLLLLGIPCDSPSSCKRRTRCILRGLRYICSVLRCLGVIGWGLLILVRAQSDFSLSAIWREYRYAAKDHQLYGEENFWGITFEKGKSVIYRFQGATAPDTLWRGSLEIERILPGRYNPDEALLFRTEERLYRRSARYRMYLFSGGQAISIPGTYQEAELLPDGGVILADSQNLYLWRRDRPSLEQLTSCTGAIRAGTTDWLYEEEFGFTKAFAVSPSGAYLAYLAFDNTETPTWTLSYDEPDAPYPRYHTFPYPKVGQKNPRISLHLLSLADRSDKILLQDTAGGYIPLFFWSEMGDKLYFVHLKRLQNAFTLYKWEPNRINQVFFQDSTPYWFNLDNRRLFIQREDQPEFFYKAERGGPTIIERYDYKGRRLAQYIIPGLKDLLGYAQGKLFFTAWGKDPTAQRVGYLDLRRKSPVPQWLTTDTLWAEVQVSTSLLAITESAPLTPPRSYILDVATLKERYDLPDLNNHLRKQIPPLQVRFFRFAAESGDSLWASLLLPANFDPGKKYPVLVRFYGGPSSQTVSREFGGIWFFWEARLVQKGFLVAHVDGRGTALYEGKQRYGIYKDLGTLETADVVDFVQYLRRQPYVEKVYGMGWSFGGYVAARLAMEAPPDALAGAISIAPVTDWRLYDSAYTERFMQTPAENPDGYERTSLIKSGRRLQAPLLLIHGEADDNVHVQNSYLLIEALLRRYPEDPLTWCIYPGQNHGIGRYRYHLFLEVERFLGVRE